MNREDVAKKTTSILSSVSNKDFSQLLDICLEQKKFSIAELLKSCEIAH